MAFLSMLPLLPSSQPSKCGSGRKMVMYIVWSLLLLIKTAVTGSIFTWCHVSEGNKKLEVMWLILRIDNNVLWVLTVDRLKICLLAPRICKVYSSTPYYCDSPLNYLTHWLFVPGTRIHTDCTIWTCLSTNPTVLWLCMVPFLCWGLTSK